MKKIGYFRLSNVSDLEERMETLRQFGCKEVLYDDTSVSLSSCSVLHDVLNRLEQGDTLCLLTMRDICINPDRMFIIFDKCLATGVDILALEENIDTRYKQFKTTPVELLKVITELYLGRKIVSSNSYITHTRKRHIWTEERVKTLIALYSAGEPLSEIMVQMGTTSKSNIFSVLKKNSIPLRKNRSIRVNEND